MLLSRQTIRITEPATQPRPARRRAVRLWHVDLGDVPPEPAQPIEATPLPIRQPVLIPPPAEGMGMLDFSDPAQSALIALL